jgi:hypothetical protein
MSLSLRKLGNGPKEITKGERTSASLNTTLQGLFFGDVSASPSPAGGLGMDPMTSRNARPLQPISHPTSKLLTSRIGVFASPLC